MGFLKKLSLTKELKALYPSDPEAIEAAPFINNTFVSKLNDPKENEKAAERRKEQAKFVKTVGGVDLYGCRVGKTLLLTAFNPDKTRIVYSLEYSFFEFQETLLVVQTAVWKDSKVKKPWADSVVYDYLLTEKPLGVKGIITDAQQSTKAKNLWQRLAKTAFDKSWYVFSVDLHRGFIVRLRNLKDIIDGEIWDEDDPNFRFQRLVISEDNLWPNASVTKEFLK